MIPMTPVLSTSITAIGHDAETNTLAVRFINGRVHHFADCDAAAYAALVGAESIGKHFNTQIRGKFAHTRIEDEPTTDASGNSDDASAQTPASSSPRPTR